MTEQGSLSNEKLWQSSPDGEIPQPVIYSFCFRQAAGSLTKWFAYGKKSLCERCLVKEIVSHQDRICSEWIDFKDITIVASSHRERG